MVRLCHECHGMDGRHKMSCGSVGCGAVMGVREYAGRKRLDKLHGRGVSPAQRLVLLDAGQVFLVAGRMFVIDLP